MQLDHEKNILSSQLEIQEQTFRHISQEIHDNISLSLTLAKLHLNTHNMKVKSLENELVESSIDLISKALVDLNDISKSMDSDLIESHGLIHAIEFEVEILQKTGLHKIDFTVNGTPFYMDTSRELVLFRMIQESCNNILKHADAENIRIELAYEKEWLTVQITDDGKGFDPLELQRQKTIGSNAGLKNIQLRAALLDGKIQILSQPLKGTSLVFEIPLIKSYESAESH
jgi:signal transduction histidine kinase